jgi:hypothetical protein
LLQIEAGYLPNMCASTMRHFYGMLVQLERWLDAVDTINIGRDGRGSKLLAIADLATTPQVRVCACVMLAELTQASYFTSTYIILVRICGVCLASSPRTWSIQPDPTNHTPQPGPLASGGLPNLGRALEHALSAARIEALGAAIDRVRVAVRSPP